MTVSRVALKCAALVSWLFIVFGFSSDNGTESAQKSGSLLVSLVNLIAPSLGATMENYNNLAALENCERVLRKFAHLFEYGVLAFLTFLLVCEIAGFARRLRDSSYRLSDCPYRLRDCPCRFVNVYTASELFVLVIGTIDEINQTRTVGRYGSVFDVIVDAVGGAIALLICLMVKHKRDKIRKKKG